MYRLRFDLENPDDNLVGHPATYIYHPTMPNSGHLYDALVVAVVITPWKSPTSRTPIPASTAKLPLYVTTLMHGAIR